MSLHRRRHERLGLLGVGDVGLDVAGPGQLGGERFARLHRRRRVDDDDGPGGGEHPCRGRPDPARGPRHQGDLSLQLAVLHPVHLPDRVCARSGCRLAPATSAASPSSTLRAMRLVSFLHRDRQTAEPDPAAARTGVVVDDEVVDLTDPAVGLPGDMAELLVAGPDALDRASAAPATAARRHPLATVRLLAPVPRPPKVMGIGMNYAAHVAEMGRPRPNIRCGSTSSAPA